MKLCVIFFAFVLLFCTQSFAQQALPSETRLILKSIAQRYKKLGIWKARFTQENYSPGLATGSLSEGEFEFMAPNLFRYSLYRPEASDFISNGKEAWQIIFKKGRDRPAFVRHFGDLTKIDLQKYLMVLKGIEWKDASSEKKLTQDFQIQGKAEKTEFRLELQPRQASDLTSLTFFFKNNVEPPYRISLKDALDAKTDIVITSFDILQKPIDKKHFEPSYPKGSEVEEL